MTEDFPLVAIVALLPLTACMLVVQVNPYHALVLRGILGAVAALVYALFGAADVALTEALVGTMLSITLYAVAVRSSLSMRLGVLEHESKETAENAKFKGHLNQLLPVLHPIFRKYHLRVELVTYTNLQTLEAALMTKEVHTTSVLAAKTENSPQKQHFYHLQTRIKRLYEIMQAEIPPTVASLTYVKPAYSQSEGNHLISNPVEEQS